VNYQDFEPAKGPQSLPKAVLLVVITKGAITSKIKDAIKLKTSPARLAQLLQPSSAFCLSLQSMTAYRPGLHSCVSLAGLVLSFIACFIACFILLVIAP